MAEGGISDITKDLEGFSVKDKTAEDKSFKGTIPSPQGNPKSVPIESIAGHDKVIFNLETTDFYRRNERVAAHITHIAAIRFNGAEEPDWNIESARECGNGIGTLNGILFSKFVLPLRPINPRATEHSGISIDNIGMNFHGGRVANVHGIRDALKQFCEFLGDTPVVLYGHNCKSYACHVLLHAAEACGTTMYDLLCQKIAGFVDTLYWFKGFDVWADQESFTLENLHLSFFGTSIHVPDNPDALAKVKALYKLMLQAGIDGSSPDSAQEHSFTFQYVKDVREHSLQVQACRSSWDPLVAAGILSDSVAKRAAGSGLLLDHLYLAFHQGGEQSVTSVLSQTAPDGKPRVTNIQRVLSAVVAYVTQNPQAN